MNEPTVIVMRLFSGDDLIGILSSINEFKIQLQFPHNVKFNHSTGTVSMTALCPLSDEVFYDFSKAHCQFVVTASAEVTQKFMEMIDSGTTEDDFASALSQLSESDTKH